MRFKASFAAPTGKRYAVVNLLKLRAMLNYGLEQIASTTDADVQVQNLEGFLAIALQNAIESDEDGNPITVQVNLRCNQTT